MKQAMLITAYKDFDTLLLLLKYYSQEFNCYVHIDSKSVIPQYFKQMVCKIPNVTVVQKYRINWGSYKHISAVIHLLRLSLNDGCEYFHVLTGNTFPIKNIHNISKFYEDNRNNVFIEFSKNAEDEIKRRQNFFFFEHIYDLKSDRGYTISELILNLQRKLHIHRKPSLSYKGYFYCHFNDNFAKFVLYYLRQHPLYFERLKTYLIPEEFFFQNILMNSPYAKENINEISVYDVWEKDAGSPQILNMTQISEAVESPKMFARKIEGVASAEHLLRLLNDF